MQISAFTLLSLPHSGTHFVQDLFRPFVRHNWAHIHPEFHERRFLTVEGTIIVPMRHPDLIGQTWLGWQDTLHNLRWSWDKLLTVVLPKEPLFLPVDCPKIRQQYLDKINATLGFEVKTEWKPVHAKGKRVPYVETDQRVLDLYTDICGGVYL